MSTINEGNIPQTDYSDVVIKIEKITPLPPERQKWSAMSVIATMPTGGTLLPTDGQLFNMQANNNDFSSFVDPSELGELTARTGVIRLFNTDDFDTQIGDIIAKAKEWGDTVIFLSKSSLDWLALATKPLLDDLIVWLTCASNEPSAAFKLHASRTNQGVMVDVAREGKLLFAITELLSLPESIKATHQINSSNFNGVLTVADASMLEGDGLSYWFNSRQLIWPDGLFLGKVGAYPTYWDRIVTFSIKTALAAFVQAGHTFNDVALVSTIIADTLGRFIVQLNPAITSFSVPSLNEISLALRTAGTLAGVEINYELNNEIRRIAITIGG